MKYQFSFSDKQELIFINEKPFEAKIGALIASVIETKWSEIRDKLEEFSNEMWEEKSGGERIFRLLEDADLHPALLRHLSIKKGKERLLESIDQINSAKENVVMILEVLVDEDRTAYSDALFELLYMTDPNMLTQYFLYAEEPKVLSFSERIMPIYAPAKDYPFLFEVEDVRTILFQEIQHLCSNDFIIRKCVHCSRYFWTLKINQVYCDRKVLDTGKTCSQIMPSQRNKSKHSEAYKEYWKTRIKLFNRQSRSPHGKDQFHTWMNKIKPYKSLARENKISLEEMRKILEELESEVYGAKSGRMGICLDIEARTEVEL